MESERTHNDKLSVDDACSALLSASINKIGRSLLVHTRNVYIICERNIFHSFDRLPRPGMTIYDEPS